VVTEIILGLVIIGLIAMHYQYVKDMNDLIAKLTKAVMAKDLTDFTVSEKIEENKDGEAKKEDFMPLEDIEDDKFIQTRSEYQP